MDLRSRRASMCHLEAITITLRQGDWSARW